MVNQIREYLTMAGLDEEFVDRKLLQYSKHVDINPGDRLEKCQGLLKPIGIEKGKKADYKIIYECQKCHKRRKNVSAKDDNIEEIIKISTNSY